MNSLQKILAAISSGFATLENDGLRSQVAELSGEVSKANGKLDQILAILNPPDPIAGTVATISPEGEKSMVNKLKPHAATSADVSILDNGKALITVTTMDADNFPTPLSNGQTAVTTFTSSDPSVIATPRPDGLTADAALIATPRPDGLTTDAALVSSPPATLPTGVTFTCVTTVTNTDATTLGPFTSVTATPLDVAPGAIAGTTAFVAAE